MDRAPPVPEEWLLELGNEVPNPSHDRLPLVLARDEIQTVVATGTELEKLAWDTLYATGLREDEFLELTPEDLKEDHLVADGRQVAIDLEVLKQLHRLETKRLFPWDRSQLRKRLRQAARKTGALERFERSGRKLLPSTFRHAYAAHRLENGMDLLTLKALLGRCGPP